MKAGSLFSISGLLVGRSSANTRSKRQSLGLLSDDVTQRADSFALLHGTWLSCTITEDYQTQTSFTLTTSSYCEALSQGTPLSPSRNRLSDQGALRTRLLSDGDHAITQSAPNVCHLCLGSVDPAALPSRRAHFIDELTRRLYDV